MVNLKWILRSITVCCVILPVLATVVVYHDNLLGLLLPPELTAAMAGNSHELQELVPDVRDLRDVSPTVNDDFHFDPEDGSYGFSINVTSPLDAPVTFDALSITVTDENGTSLGTVSLGNPVTLAPGTNSTIPIEGYVNEELIALLQDSGIDLTDPDFSPENLEDLSLDMTNLRFTDVDIDIGGIQIHIDELNLNELVGALESGSTDGS